MKKILLACALLLVKGSTFSQLPNTWTQKVDFGGIARRGAVGFSIGSKGYLGTGDGGGFKKDFWEYDPVLNTWTQKADFGGSARYAAVGFSIDNKGYVGTGYDGFYKKDFWEYDPVLNTWTQRADFAGTARLFAVGFSIGSKGYLGTGQDFNSDFKKDFWEYDPNGNSWTQKADFGGTTRFYAAGFSISSKGYLGTGFDFSNIYNDFWEYDPNANAWAQKANFGGTARFLAVGFSIGTTGYLGTGYDQNNLFKKDFWEYDPDANTWTQKTDFGGTARYIAVGFSIGNKGYLGTGSTTTINTKDFWEYIPDEGCSAPTNLSSTSITATTAKLNWDELTGSLGYQLFYKSLGASSWIVIHTISSYKKLTGLTASTTYHFKVKSICGTSPLITSDNSAEGSFTTAPLRTSPESAEQISIQIFPNPAQDQATIHFSLAQSSNVIVKVYDVSGKEIMMLLNDELERGDHSIQLSTAQFAKGVYLVKMVSDAGIENQKLVVQ